MIINDLAGHNIVFDTKNRNTELDTLLTIPASVTYIGDHAFLSCENMTELHMKSKTAPKYGGDKGSGLGFGGRKIDLYVPKGCKEAYNKTPWKYNNIIEE